MCLAFAKLFQSQYLWGTRFWSRGKILFIYYFSHGVNSILWLLWSQIVLKGMQGKSWNGVQIHVMILMLVYSSLVFAVYSLILATEQCGKRRRAFRGPFSPSAFFFTASMMCPPGELACKFLGDSPVTTFHLVLETMQLCKHNDSYQVRLVIMGCRAPNSGYQF